MFAMDSALLVASPVPRRAYTHSIVETCTSAPPGAAYSFGAVRSALQPDGKEQSAESSTPPPRGQPTLTKSVSLAANMAGTRSKGTTRRKMAQADNERLSSAGSESDLCIYDEDEEGRLYGPLSSLSREDPQDNEPGADEHKAMSSQEASPHNTQPDRGETDQSAPVLRKGPVEDQAPLSHAPMDAFAAAQQRQPSPMYTVQRLESPSTRPLDASERPSAPSPPRSQAPTFADAGSSLQDSDRDSPCSHTRQLERWVASPLISHCARRIERITSEAAVSELRTNNTSNNNTISRNSNISNGSSHVPGRRGGLTSHSSCFTPVQRGEQVPGRPYVAPAMRSDSHSSDTHFRYHNQRIRHLQRKPTRKHSSHKMHHMRTTFKREARV